MSVETFVVRIMYVRVTILVAKHLLLPLVVVVQICCQFSVQVSSCRRMPVPVLPQSRWVWIVDSVFIFKDTEPSPSIRLVTWPVYNYMTT